MDRGESSKICLRLRMPDTQIFSIYDLKRLHMGLLSLRGAVHIYIDGVVLCFTCFNLYYQYNVAQTSYSSYLTNWN